MQPIISAGGFALKLDVTNENEIIDVVEHVIKIEKKLMYYGIMLVLVCGEPSRIYQ